MTEIPVTLPKVENVRHLRHQYSPEEVRIRSEKYLQRLQPFVDEVESQRPEQLRILQETGRFELPDLSGASKEDLDKALPLVFAAFGAALEKTTGKTPRTNQLQTAMILHNNGLPQLPTGEGKTIAVGHAAALNALSGEGVHVITANNYLAEYAVSFLGPAYTALGLKVAVILESEPPVQYIYDPDSPGDHPDFPHLRALPPEERYKAYQADIVYGAQEPFIFDRLRDRQSPPEKRVQRKLHYAIVDEVDNVLMDKAKTPNVFALSELPTETEKDCLRKFNDAVARLQEVSTDRYSQYKETEIKGKPQTVSGDYVIEGEPSDFIADREHPGKTASIIVTQQGYDKLEDMLGVKLFEEDTNWGRYLHNAIEARFHYKRDHDYVVVDGRVLLLDQKTGRILADQRLGDGLHQALEAKEGVDIQGENIIYEATTTQRFFKEYERLAGTTGTAVPSARTFEEIYNLPIITVPAHKKIDRVEFPTQLYSTHEGKINAIVASVKRRHQNGQPILVGASSIEEAKLLESSIYQEGLTCERLDATQDAREAGIIAQAGIRGAITIATNMAGRGTDIVLGGPDASEDEQQALAKETGGLHVIVTEVGESRRIMDQLIGRGARNGLPGSYEIVLSREDPSLRSFGFKKAEQIAHKTYDRLQRFAPPWRRDQGWIDKRWDKALHVMIDRVQQVLESRNADALEFGLRSDEVVEEERRIIEKQRENVFAQTQTLSPVVEAYITDVITDILQSEKLEKSDPTILTRLIPIDPSELQLLPRERKKAYIDRIIDLAIQEYQKRKDNYRKLLAEVHPEEIENFDAKILQRERLIFLTQLSHAWSYEYSELQQLLISIQGRGNQKIRVLDAFKLESQDVGKRYDMTIKELIVRAIFSPYNIE